MYNFALWQAILVAWFTSPLKSEHWLCLWFLTGYFIWKSYNVFHISKLYVQWSWWLHFKKDQDGMYLPFKNISLLLFFFRCDFVLSNNWINRNFTVRKYLRQAAFQIIHYLLLSCILLNIHVFCILFTIVVPFFR